MEDRETLMEELIAKHMQLAICLCKHDNSTEEELQECERLAIDKGDYLLLALVRLEKILKERENGEDKKT